MVQASTVLVASVGLWLAGRGLSMLRAQATEVLKEILGIGDSMSGRLLLWDALDSRFRTIRLRRDPACVLCGGGEGA